MVHIAKDLMPGYDLHQSTGIRESIAIPIVDAASRILDDIIEADLFLEFVTYLIRYEEEGVMGRTITVSYLREIIKEIYSQGYLFDKEQRLFIEDSRVRKSRNWGVMKTGRDYTVCFLRVDIVGNTRLVKENTREEVQSAYGFLRSTVQSSTERRNGRVWLWEGDGGVAAFFFGNRNQAAALAGIEILHELFLYNKMHCPLSSDLRVRIGVHSGSCEYTEDNAVLVKSETVLKLLEVEKSYSKPNHCTISVTVREMLDHLVSSQFKPLTGCDKSCFSYALEFSE